MSDIKQVETKASGILAGAKSAVETQVVTAEVGVKAFAKKYWPILVGAAIALTRFL